MCWNKGAPQSKHKEWGDRVGAPARLSMELGIIGAVGCFAGFFGGERCLRSVCCSWHQHSVSSASPAGIFIPTQTASLHFPARLRFPGEFTTNQRFNIPHITSAFWKDPAGKKKNHILLVFESSSSPSPLALLPFLSRACFLKEKRTYQPKDSIATFSSLSPMGRKLKLN